MTIPSYYYSKKAARPSQSPAVTALPEGEPRVCDPLYKRIPRWREAVRPYNRLPSVRPVFSLSFRGREAPVGIRSPRPQARNTPASLCAGEIV